MVRVCTSPTSSNKYSDCDQGRITLSNVHPTDRVENLVNRILNANSIFDNTFVNQVNANQDATNTSQWLDPDVTAFQAYHNAMYQLILDHLVANDFEQHRKLYPSESYDDLKQMVIQAVCYHLKRNIDETIGDHKLRLTRWARERLLQLSFSRPLE